MLILKNIKELREWRKNQQGKIGFIPTMGALHQGHLSLMQQSKKENDINIVSIFVNPTQFGVNEDFKQYPRNQEKDIKLCKNIGIDALFMPNENTMYPFSDETTLMPPPTLSNVFEGKLRKGHFSGVLRIIIKFFHLIQPHNAYFGEKDAQQLLIVKKMVKDLFLDINIIGCPIIRDDNNLALSSRNIYLSEDSYRLALKIPQSILLAKDMFLKGETKSQTIENLIKNNLSPLEADYCNVVNFDLECIEEIQKNASLLVLAVRVGGVRLLDNLWF